MNILIIILFLLCLYGIKFRKFHSDYINKESSDAIKGIFTIIILYSHLRSYLPKATDDNSSYLFYLVINLLGQLMVVMFLFYSGYGILESYGHKKKYLSNFLTHRVLKTLLTFDYAVVLFVILALVLEKDYSLYTYVMSFTAWENIGNSNWFVFDIIILYLIAFIGLRFHSKFHININVLVSVLYIITFFLIAFLYYTKQSSYWYDTVLAFPTGMLFSIYKDKFESMTKKPLQYWLSMFISVVLFATFYFKGDLIGSLINSILFPILIVLFTVKIKINNAALRWLGINCFAIYILQRIPMIIFSELNWNNNWLLFSIAVIPSTLVLATVFTAATNHINNRIFSSGRYRVKK